tara:strand:- start:1052 stop:1492 length:441 start_codon:yes stop_codon:yes gene_type:complete
MPRSRRQEFLRTMIKIGFLNTYGNGSTEGKESTKELPKESAERTKVDRKPPSNQKNHVSKNKVSTNPKVDNLENHQGDEVEVDSVTGPAAEESSASAESSSNNYMSGNEPKSSQESSVDDIEHSDEDDVIDSLDEFKGLFDGLNDS